MSRESYIVLCGGVGGSKLADGLARILDPEQLTIVANTGDDFDHLGLRICPDIDTITYMLAGLVHPERGWGRKDESWNTLETLRVFGGEDWFLLGDRDLALHLHRSQALREGKTLSEVTAAIASALGVKHRIVPMCEEPVRTIIKTSIGELAFQEYFVRHRCEPRVTGIRFEGIEAARPPVQLLRAMEAETLRAVLVAPSNPLLSIDPILTVPGLRDAIVARGVPVVAVSPLIGGASVKGPAAKLISELGYPTGNFGICEFYGSLLKGIIIDCADEAERHRLNVRTKVYDTLMKNADDRIRVARSALDFVAELQ